MMERNEHRILVEHAGYTYEEAPDPALKGINLAVKPGEFVAVLGHNGSGKSTLAKLLNALYVPTEGRVLVCGMDTADDDRVWDIRQQAGMIFQNPDNQIVATVVKEDVAFGLENMGVPQPEMLSRIESALATVGMSKYAEREPSTLSGGQKQRVAIAGILAMEPSCIIADESTAMLDPSGRREVLDTIRSLNKNKAITVVWITHYMEEVTAADRVIVVNHGEAVMNGTPREIFSQVDKLREMHLDVPPMTALAHELKSAGMPVSCDVLDVDEMLKEVCRLCPSN